MHQEIMHIARGLSGGFIQKLVGSEGHEVLAFHQGGQGPAFALDDFERHGHEPGDFHPANHHFAVGHKRVQVAGSKQGPRHINGQV